MKHDEASILVRRVVAFNIRRLRKSLGQNETQFAKMINVNRSYYSQIENGEANITLDLLVKITNGLDLPITMLFESLEGQAPCKLPRDTVYALIKLDT